VDLLREAWIPFLFLWKHLALEAPVTVAEAPGTTGALQSAAVDKSSAAA